MSGPDGAKDLFAVVKDPDRQGRFVMSMGCCGFMGVQSPILGFDGSQVVNIVQLLR